jgi:hypothetical protein
MKNEGSIVDGLNIYILLQPILNHTYIMFQRDFKEIGRQHNHLRGRDRAVQRKIHTVACCENCMTK